VFKEVKPAVIMFMLMTVLTGVIYPGVVTAIGQLAFEHAANGSIVTRGGRAVGSELLGQFHREPRYFWGRPSATGPNANNGAISSGSNLAATNPNLEAVVRERVAALKAADPECSSPVPVDLVTASASGLDPHISPAAAEFQVSRVARVRGLAQAQVRTLVAAATESRTLGFLSEPRVNVLQLNLALDAQEEK
jgi:potassium-transporting ATPase KdpC subunit